jgi:uncharacterized protein YggE
MPVVLVLLLSLLSATTAAAAEPARTVTVEGQARVVASPDRAAGHLITSRLSSSFSRRPFHR